MSEQTPIEMLEVVASALADLCDEIVFVGGTIVALLITDPAAPPVSSTKDIDLVVSVTTRYEYSEKLGGRLRALNFSEDSSEGAPLCRWRRNGMRVDVMPTNPDILGFSNRWFPLAFETSVRVPLPSGREVRIPTASCFLGTKLEAFHSRGKGDFLSSKDIEDFLAVVHGRDAVVQEVAAAPEELKSYLAENVSALLRKGGFVDSIEGHLPGEDREVVLGRLRRICALGASLL